MADAEGGHGSTRSQRFRGTSAYDTLKAAILGGELKPGEPLVEATLAALCNTSRTPVREALTRLEQDGLVDRSDRGMVVRRRSVDEILDVYEVRLVLEATAGRFAAERRTSNEILLMRQLLGAGEAVSGDDPRAMVEINERFHMAVWKAAHNESLFDLLDRIHHHLGRYPETTLSFPRRWETAKKQHEQLVDAIEMRDGAVAHELAWQHFADAREIRLKLFAQDLGLEPGPTRSAAQ